MSPATIRQRPAFSAAELAQLRKLELPETDGKPMDSPWQRKNITGLAESFVHHRRREKRGFVGANMCLYYSLEQVKQKRLLGPDFFFVKDADPHKLRTKWEVWNEDDQFPNVIIELLSPTTKKNDLGSKKQTYEEIFRTREYFAYDPDDQSLIGWQLSPITDRYEPLEANSEGRVYSEELEVWLGTWQGTMEGETTTWLRFFHDDDSLVLRPEEAERAAKETERAAKEEALKRESDERAAKEEAHAEIERLRKLLETR